MSLLLLTLLGCGSDAPEAPSPDVRTVGMAPVAEAGLLTEAQFKAAHALKSDAEGPPLKGSSVDVDGAVGYLSLPEGEPKGAVLVIHEWWGLNDHIRRWTDRLAEAGYVALAVDLYGGTVATTRDEAMEAMKAVDPVEALKVLAAGHKLLGSARFRAGKRAVIGWCFGGGWALQHAIATGSDLDAAVMYYGRPVTDVDELKKIKAPVFGVFANNDEGIPPSAVDELEAAMKEAKRNFTVARFDADHAFANPSSDRYDTAAAEEAWKKVQAFLAEALKPDPDEKEAKAKAG